MVLGLFGVSWVMPKSIVELSMLARSSSSKWPYMDCCSALFDVASLEGKI